MAEKKKIGMDSGGFKKKEMTLLKYSRGMGGMIIVKLNALFLYLGK